MKKLINKFLSCILAICLITMAFTGCDKRDDEVKKENQTSIEVKSSSNSVDNDKSEKTESSEIEASSQNQKEETYVYIGTYSTELKKYAVDISGDVTPDKLIAAIADLTGWNLTLSDTVTSGKGGMSVSFSHECALVTGPPMEQKDEFHVYDNYNLANMILDSIQETLQRNFVMEPGDPSNLDIWYSMEDKPIEIEGVIISMDEPWGKQKIFR